MRSPLLAAIFTTGVTWFGASPSLALADQASPKKVTCTARIPDGATAPTMEEAFPGDAVAGYKTPLGLVIRHGRGETPLASSFRVATGSDVAKNLEEAGFVIANTDAIQVDTSDEGAGSVSRVTIPLISVPTHSGTHSAVLPRLPIAVSRANGDVMTICTQLHMVTVTDPTTDQEAPLPRPNPPLRPQFEPWPLAKWLLAGGVLTFVLLVAFAWWLRSQLRRPVPEDAGAAPLPWEEVDRELAALEKRLSAIEGARAQGDGPDLELTAFYDEVSDVLRRYLGRRYGFEGLGFEGLETTSAEMLGLLGRVRPAVGPLDEVELFLADCDLVKFARLTPTHADCRTSVSRARAIVTQSIPKTDAPPTQTVGEVLAAAHRAEVPEVPSVGSESSSLMAPSIPSATLTAVGAEGPPALLPPSTIPPPATLSPPIQLEHPFIQPSGLSETQVDRDDEPANSDGGPGPETPAS